MLHIDLPTRAEFESLVLNRGAAHVSIYLPTTPMTQQAQADRIALKNLVSEAIGQLSSHDKRELRDLQESLLDIVDDDFFWSVQANSLAIFATPEHVQTFRLPNRLEAALEVSDRFHIRPLLRVMTTPQSAFILALSQNAVRVVEVSSDMPAQQVRIADLPTDAASAVGKSKAALSDRSPSGRIQGDEGRKVRLTQFARAVDAALRDFLAGRDEPLVLASTDPLLSIYRGVQSYPHLAAEAIRTNPEGHSEAELAKQARTILDALFQQEIQSLHQLYHERMKEHRTTNDVAQAARAASRGAIQTLLIDIDGSLPGTLTDDGAIQFADGPCPASYDLVDEIAGRAFLTGARVLGVRAADIPGGGPLAALMRYPF